MMEDKISLMSTQVIHTAAPFQNLFPIKESVLNEIAEDMRKNGFDYAHPIIIWAGHKVTVVDGHTRLAAARQIHLNNVPITLKDFADEDEALQYAIRAQSHRRNLTDAELLSCLQELDKKKALGRPGKVASTEATSKGKSAKRTADLLGVSRATVERLRTVNEHAPSKIKDAVYSGQMSARKAYEETMKQRRLAEAKKTLLSADELLKLKTARLENIKKDILKFVVARLEQEFQECPEIRYTAMERDGLKDILSSEIGNKITTIIPREDENEQ